MRKVQIRFNKKDIRRRSSFIISAISGSHGLFHSFDQSLVVLLPEIKDTFNLSNVGVGALAATQQIAEGIISLPAGIASDMNRQRWGQILAGCMLLFGLGWLVVGSAPFFPILLIGIGMVFIASSVWHLPATAALSEHFPRKRATVLSLHTIGGNIGDIIGPVITTGLFLSLFTWRGVISIYAAVPLFLVLVVMWAFKNIGAVDNTAYTSPTLRDQLSLTKRLLQSRVLWGLGIVSTLRNMTFVSLVWFLPIYFDQELGMSVQGRGLLMGLLFLVGLFSTPVLGYLSDRYGRKTVLVPSLVSLCVLTLLLIPFGQGLTLTILIALISLFLYGDQPILMAAALDMVEPRVVNTTLGVLSLIRVAPSAAAPVISGWLYQSHGIAAMLYFIASIFLLSAIVFALLPLKGSLTRIS